MLLSHLNRNIPMIQKNTTIHSLFILTQSFITFHRILSHACKLETIRQLAQNWVIFRNFINYLSQAIIILDHGKAFDETFVIFSRNVEFGSFVPLQAFSIIVAQLIGHLVEGLIITWSFSDHLQYPKPISYSNSHINCQIFSLQVPIDIFSCIVLSVQD